MTSVYYTRTLKTYRAMRQRVKKHPNYTTVSICDRWLESLNTAGKEYQRGNHYPSQKQSLEIYCSHRRAAKANDTRLLRSIWARV